MMRLLLTLSIVVTSARSEDDYVEVWERPEIFQREPVADELVQLYPAGPYSRVKSLRWTWDGQLVAVLHGFAVGARKGEYRALSGYSACADDYINREDMQMVDWERVRPAEV